MAQALPRNVDVADQLDLLADLLEIEGEAAKLRRGWGMESRLS